MSRRDPLIALRQMRDHAREALALLHNRSRADLGADRMLNLALVRLLEIVGEAAARVEPNERTGFPGIPWQQVVGLRNRLIHGYDTVDLDLLWSIAIEDLPALVAELDRALGG
jgi:uncharacterized protein with HEPN domain